MAGRPAISLEEKFWGRVSTTNTCWLWQGFLDKDGYGFVYDRKKRMPVTHASLLVHGRPAPYPGALALHSCDNPSCVNPDHLRWGTQKENIQDRQQRNRQATGERCGSARLTSKQVDEIRGAVGTQWEIAHRYGVNQSTVSQIKRRRTWVSGATPLPAPDA